MFGAKAVGQATSFAPDYGKAMTAAGRIFALLDRPSEIDQRWSNIRLATRPESVTRDRRATYEG